MPSTSASATRHASLLVLVVGALCSTNFTFENTTVGSSAVESSVLYAVFTTFFRTDSEKLENYTQPLNKDGPAFHFPINYESSVFFVNDNAALMSANASFRLLLGPEGSTCDYQTPLIEEKEADWKGYITGSKILTFNATSSSACAHAWISFAYYRNKCDDEYFGFSCSKYCHRHYENTSCYDCDKVNGATICCSSEDIDQKTCVNKTAQSQLPTGTVLESSSKNKEKLFLWLLIGVACLCLVLLLIAVVAIAIAFTYYRRVKKSSALHYRPPERRAAVNTQPSRTTHSDADSLRSPAGGGNPQGVYAVSNNVDSSFDSLWPPPSESREALV